MQLIYQYSPEDLAIIVSTPTLEVEDAWSAAVQSVPWAAAPFSYDEFSTNLANFYLEQEDAYLTPKQLRPAKDHALKMIVTVVDSGGGSAVDVAGVGDHTVTLVIPRTRQRPRHFEADDPLFFAAVQAAYEDEAAWLPAVQAIPKPPQTFADEDAGTQLRYFFLEQEEPWVAVYETIPWLPRPVSDDEYSTNLANFAREQEEPWTAAIQVRPWNPLPFSDDEISSITPTQTMEDERAWTATYQAIPWLAKPYTDDEFSTALKNFAREQEEPWTASVQTIAWQARPYTDDDLYPAQPTRLLHDEPWIDQVQRIVWTPRAFLDDEFSTSLKNFVLEQEEPWLAMYQARPWEDRPFLDDEFSTALRNFAREQEEPWTAMYMVRPWLPLPFLDDEIRASLIVHVIVCDRSIIAPVRSLDVPGKVRTIILPPRLRSVNVEC